MEKQIKQKIEEYIKSNRVSTTEVADCLGKSGVVKGVYPIVSGLHKVGKIKYVYGFLESNWSIHEQIRDSEKGDIIFIDGIEVGDRALMGELVTKYLLLYREAEAVVVNGFIRDANGIIRMKYAVWSKGVTPVGCFNIEKEETEEITAYAKRRKEELDGAIAVCDDTGVVVIPKEEITEAMLEKLERIEAQEDEWFYCIDRRKWDTYDTVCLKKYLDEG